MTIQSMAEALAARDAGVQESSNHAEMDAPGWGERAYLAVSFSPLAASFKEWTLEEMRIHVMRFFPIDSPPDLRAWGSVTQRLIRDGIIEPVGYARAASSNGSPKRTYRLTRGVATP